MRSNAWPERALGALAACSLEGAWILLAYVTVEGLTGHVPPRLTLVVFATAALAGLGIARWSARHPRVPYRTTVVVAALAAAVVGWWLPLGSAAGLLDAPLATIERHPAGLLLGLAVLRGTAHVTPEDDERIASRALGPGLALVAGAWLLLTAGGATREPAILEAAFAATVTFVTAGLLSIGLARLADPRGAGTLEARRRTLTGLLVGVVAALLAIALPLALVVGVPAHSAVQGVLGPVADVAVAVGALFVLPLGFLAALLVEVLMFLRDTFGIGGLGTALGQLAEDLRRLIVPSGPDGISLGIVPLLVAIVVALLLVRWLLVRPRITVVGRDVTEVRELERPTGGIGLRRPRLPRARRRGDPATASEAYLASLEVLAGSPGSGRLGSETPAEHARRLRTGPAGPDLGRLAADYALAEFGRRRLPASEHRRAVDRWRRIRAALRR